MPQNAQVVKLVDTLASGASDRKVVEVQVLSWAPSNLLFLKIKIIIILLGFNLKSHRIYFETKLRPF